MSRNAVSAASEGIDGVGRGRRPHVRLKTLAADNINRTIEQLGDVILEGNLFVHAHLGRRIDLDHNIDVAVRPVVTARARAE